jgi:putative ABC transport system ATP-binding protein
VTDIARPTTDTRVAPVDTTSPPIVRLEEVIKVYREVDVETIALRGVDLTVAEGEFVAIMGRSGSGKSTLLNLLSGSDRPTAGRVTVAGVSMDRGAESERAGLRGKTVGIVFQTQNLVPFLTLEENVRLAGDLAGSPLDAEAANALLARVGLRDRASHRPEQLSGGEQQRAALACVLAGRPRLLLADEITGELDSSTADDLLKVVRELHETEQMTVILVTHDPRVADTADRIVELRDGRVFADRRPA